ncbi:MAG: FmdB family transcriptional regulator [Spirochaetia bacterium]|nr:FmdB family transcriptional regulator [Spirochaetia bacterium]
MPYYEYACDECDSTFEIFQSMSEEPIKTCPTCSSPIRRVFDASSIIFKGSGFYSTDTKVKKKEDSSVSKPKPTST